MQAVGNFLIIEHIVKESKKQSGLIIPESLEKDIRYLKAKIVSKGDIVHAPVEVGDTIFYDKMSGHVISYEGKDYKVIEDRNIVLKVC